MKLTALFSYSPNVEYSPMEREIESTIFRKGKMVSVTPELRSVLNAERISVNQNTTVLAFENYVMVNSGEDSTVFSVDKE